MESALGLRYYVPKNGLWAKCGARSGFKLFAKSKKKKKKKWTLDLYLLSNGLLLTHVVN